MNKVKYDEGSGVPDRYGTKHWYVNGLRHRLDGPACEYASGNKSWFIDGEPPIEIKDQDMIVKEKIIINNNVGLVLKYISDDVYLALLGNKKVFVKRT